jgi:hypothetical protein
MEQVPVFKETLELEDVLDLPPRKKGKEPERYPKLVCENCGHHNQLHFSPKNDEFSLIDIRCANCKEFAYYQNYWRDYQMKDFRIFIFHGWIRDLVKTGKISLLNILSLKKV